MTNGNDIIEYEEMYHDVLVEKFAIMNTEKYNEFVLQEHAEQEQMLDEEAYKG